MAGNANRGSTGKNYTPAEKAAYYNGKAESEMDPVVKQHYAGKGAYWDKVSKGLEVTQEEEAAYGPGHEKGPVDQLINAKRRLAITVDPKKRELQQAKIDLLTKVVNGQDVSVEEMASVDKALSDLKQERAGAANKKIRAYNAMKLADALVTGKFPAFGEGVPVINGKVSFAPSSARSFESGRPYRGLNQFALQVLAKEGGWVPEPNGHFYFATKKMCGYITDKDGRKVVNLKDGAKAVHFATVGNAETRSEGFTALSDEAKAAAYLKSEKDYEVYNSTDMIDINRSRLNDKLDFHRSRAYDHKERVFDASEAKTPAEFFAIYDVACHYGGTFRATPAKIAEMKGVVRQQLYDAASQGLDGMVYNWYKQVDNAAQPLYAKIKEMNEKKMADMQKLHTFENSDLAEAAFSGGVPESVISEMEPEMDR